MAEKKKVDFVVSDRRKFTDEGELRSDAVTQEELLRETTRQEAPREAKVEAIPQPPPPPSAEKAVEQKRTPAPPSHSEQTAQHSEYQLSNKKLDQLLSEKTGRAVQDYEMTF